MRAWQCRTPGIRRTQSAALGLVTRAGSRASRPPAVRRPGRRGSGRRGSGRRGGPARRPVVVGVIVDTGLRVEHVGVPAALLDLFARRRHCFMVARCLLLEASGFGGLRLRLGLRGAGLRGRFVGDRLALVGLLDVCCQLLAHLLGLDVPALVTPAARGEHEPGEHDHRHDCDNDPYGGVIHDSALSMGNTRATSLTHPLIADSLQGRCRNVARRTRAHCRFWPTLTLTYSTRPTTSGVRAPSRALTGP